MADGASLDWLCELAYAEWGITPERFWDDRPNLARRVRAIRGNSREWVWLAPDDLGVTIPDLHRLIEAYGERRARELQEHGTVNALAFNDPKALQQLSRPAAAEESGSFQAWTWGGKDDGE